MKVSGFAIARNVLKADYPIGESLKSIEPLCDEIVVAIGNSDDDTRSFIANLGLKNLKIISDTLNVITFPQGTYNKTTGVADFKVKELPYLLNKMTKMHKATHKDPLYYLNIFFGVSLMFFVISSFYMFMPGTTIFKKGMYFTLAGIVLVLVMLFF